MWQKIIPIIQNNESFVITAHVNPDCDALGSELALAGYLKSLGKQVAIINSDATPKTYRFLDPHGWLKRYSPNKHNAIINKAQVIVVLDASGGWGRLGPVGKALEQTGAVKTCIDHHPDATDFVDVAVIDTDAAATGELIFNLVQAMEGTVSKEMAQALYAAIITDTGNFRFPKTSSQTHHITASLLQAGANPLDSYSRIYEQNTLGAIRLRGQVLESMRTSADGQIAYYALSKQTLKDYGVKTSELDGFAGLGQLVGGVRVTIFCMEATKGRVKISLRSDGTVAINELAQSYGGGGHPSAAGALVEGKLEPTMAELIEKVTVLMEESAQESK